MPRKVRRLTVVLHVLFSAAWIGLTLGILALGIRAYTSQDPGVVAFAYRAGDVFGEWLLVPVALATLITGLALSVGTQWGLVRHKWVLVKFVLTVITVLLVAFSMAPGLSENADRAVAGTAVADIDMWIAPLVGTTTYAFMYVISVLKPWGLTLWGRRVRAAKAKAAKAKGRPQTRPVVRQGA